MDRHINYFELQKACGKEGCPVCRIVSERADRYIDNMLFEHISDRPFRASFRAAGGFCDFHARGLASFRDGLAVAILGKDILEDRVAALKRGKAYKPKGQCPVCVERGRIEREYLGLLVEVADASSDTSSEEAVLHAELRTLFEASDGLCVPHYEVMLASFKKVPRWIRAFQEKKFDELMGRTAAFIEFSAYGRQGDFAKLSEKDQVVWKELAVALRGSCT